MIQAIPLKNNQTEDENEEDDISQTSQVSNKEDDEPTEDGMEQINNQKLRRSDREPRQREILNISSTKGQSYAQLQHCHNLPTQAEKPIEYNNEKNAPVAAFLMNQFFRHFSRETSLAQKIMLDQGMKKFGNKCNTSAFE